MTRYRINPERTHPRTGAERNHRRKLAVVTAQLRREIRAERKQKKAASSTKGK
jgi:hypothetical protein